MSEKPKYQPTERERAVLRKQAERREAETPALRVEVLSKGATLLVDHPDETVGRELLMEALGTANAHFSGGLLHTLCTAASATKGSRLDQDWFNFMLAVITGIKPNDQLEAMLAAQMAAIHIAMMTFTQRLGTVENIPQQDSAERALNKLARTFTTQMETLKRYRTGGQQNVTVHHVSVSEGGQAIVGNVTRAANDTALEKPANATPALADERQPAMESIGKPEHSPVLLRRGQKDDGQSSA
jgi:hypothetical protein